MPCSPTRLSTPRSAAAPTSLHAPQLMLSPGRPQRPAAGGQRVEEGVGRGVVGLAGRAEQRRDRRVQHEVVERRVRAVSSSRCRAPSTLGASTCRNRSQSAAPRAPSSSTPAAVEDAAQRRQRCGDRRRATATTSARLRHVAVRTRATSHARASQVGDRRRRRRRTGRAGRAGPGARAPCPTRCSAVSRPRPPSPPVTGRCRRRGSPGAGRSAAACGWRSDDLADVAGLGHEPERGHALVESEHGQTAAEAALPTRRRRPRSTSIGADAAPARRRRSRPSRSRGSRRRPAAASCSPTRCRACRSRGTARPGRAAPGCATTNSPASELSTTSTPRRRCRPGSRRRSRGAGVVDVGHAEPPQQVALRVAAGGGERPRHPRAGRGGPRPVPTPPAAAWTSTRSPARRRPTGRARTRAVTFGISSPAAASKLSSGGLGTTRSAAQVTCERRLPGATATTASPTARPSTPAPTATTTPATLAAERPRVAGVHAERVEHVLEVQPAGVDPDLDLSGAGRSAIDWAQDEVVERAAVGDGQLEGRRRPARVREVGQPGDERARAAEGELVLAAVREQPSTRRRTCAG